MRSLIGKNKWNSRLDPDLELTERKGGGGGTFCFCMSYGILNHKKGVSGSPGSSPRFVTETSERISDFAFRNHEDV